MDYQEFCFNLRLRVATLKAQMNAAETELNELKALKCPACNGTRSISRENPEIPYAVLYDTCTLCDGTGFALPS